MTQGPKAGRRAALGGKEEREQPDDKNKTLPAGSSYTVLPLLPPLPRACSVLAFSALL